MEEKTILRITRIVAVVQFLGGSGCLAGGIALYSMQNKLITDGLLTNSQIDKLTVYIWLSCLISFLLTYGLYNLREWSRKLLLLFIAFGWVNALIPLCPELSSFVTPYLPSYLPTEVYKKALLAVIDGFLIFFFTRFKIKKSFN